MIKIKALCICMLSFVLPLGCKAKEKVNDKPVISDFYIALACAGENNETNIGVSDFLRDEDKSSSYVDKNSEKIFFLEGELKLKAFKNGMSKIQLSCIGPTTHRDFFKNNNGKDVLLIANGKVIFVARAFYSGKKEGCGEMFFSDFEKSANVCFAYKNALGQPEDDCVKTCAETDSKVCIED